MEFEAFVARLRALVSVDIPNDVSRYAGLYDELGFDSFQAFELLIIVESMSGNLVPPEQVPELYTLGDAHAYYEQLRSASLGVTEG